VDGGGAGGVRGCECCKLLLCCRGRCRPGQAEKDVHGAVALPCPALVCPTPGRMLLSAAAAAAAAASRCPGKTVPLCPMHVQGLCLSAKITAGPVPAGARRVICVYTADFDDRQAAAAL
jgi:hypothetical protein